MFKKPITVDVKHTIDMEDAKALVEDIKSSGKELKKFIIQAGVVVFVGAGTLILLAAAAAVAGDVISDNLTSNE